MPPLGLKLQHDRSNGVVELLLCRTYKRAKQLRIPGLSISMPDMSLELRSLYHTQWKESPDLWLATHLKGSLGSALIQVSLCFHWGQAKPQWSSNVVESCWVHHVSLSSSSHKIMSQNSEDKTSTERHFIRPLECIEAFCCTWRLIEEPPRLPLLITDYITSWQFLLIAFHSLDSNGFNLSWRRIKAGE